MMNERRLGGVFWAGAALLVAPALALAGDKCGEKRCGELQATSVSRCGETRCGEPKCGQQVACGSCETKCGCDKKLDVDIEKLKAINAKCSTELCIEYQVDVDDACPTEQFDLVLQIWNCDQVIWTRTVPLEPTGVAWDKDTVYKGSLTDNLPNVITQRKGFKIEGNVYLRDGSHTLASNINGSLDRERERVRTSSSDHGFATPLYTLADIAYRPVTWIVPANNASY